MAAPLYQTDSGRLWHAGQILLVFVGLPARGKTHVSRSVERYLRWLGVRTKVFSLGDHRRRMLGPSANLPPDYFHPEGRSPATDELRAKVRITLEEEVARYFKENEGQVAIFDANLSNFTERYEGCTDSVEAEVRGARGQRLLH
ncbi:RHTO0S03e00452g2_1 [Rhodotorula toruloides]|uniref:RHTO0S03e00452g2_1 n=1 Tax=Rhodotorula toruloides TaxID=5286 RepID=A0A061AL43_RHOTO|nr:RHTO0S03e00452g2_1 [Rhodotorula toruloides]